MTYISEFRRDNDGCFSHFLRNKISGHFGAEMLRKSYFIKREEWIWFRVTVSELRKSCNVKSGQYWEKCQTKGVRIIPAWGVPKSFFRNLNFQEILSDSWTEYLCGGRFCHWQCIHMRNLLILGLGGNWTYMKNGKMEDLVTEDGGGDHLDYSHPCISG